MRKHAGISWMMFMWHFIFEAVPKDHDVLLAVLDHEGFHALDFLAVEVTMVGGST
jgi:hypothetical protein